ncbi:type IV pilus modification PilV family protein [Desulfovermiculus halophilus]|uniref:type IV pilus modification PilV family protein n=1 Tax=Desulfovermiculus halophilus TaxID=339722 RepID=UPI00048833D9|nr:prepilin-type N-terminal cleavage/methylation domain-containing protein [Desulfovermiculus halophilus]
MPYYAKNNSDGLTLIEVLVSMVILVVGILSVMTMLSTAAKGNAQARKMSRALNVAETKLDEFLYGDEACSGSGNLNGYEWNYNSTASNPVNGTTYCKVTVSWSSYGDEKNISLDTLRAE